MSRNIRKSQKIYENFHSSTSSQGKIIDNRNFTYKIILNVIDKYIPTSRKLKILDIGCGSGTLCYYLASKGHIVKGIDISNTAITSCKRSAKLLHLEERLSFDVVDFPNESPSGKYDVVIFTEVIEHLKDDKYALKVINNCLKSNGLLLLSTPSKNAPLYRLKYAKGFDKRVGHLRRYTPEGIDKMIKEANFEVINLIKSEGIIRNFLFLSPLAGKLIRLIKFQLVEIVSFIDKLSMRLFGESDIFIIAKKK